jgi:hypothetical protein
MDAASLKFQSVEANFEWDLNERVVKQVAVRLPLPDGVRPNYCAIARS